MKKDKLTVYLESRIEDILGTVKTSEPYDQQWLKRLAQELDWAKQMHLGIYTPGPVL